MIETFRLSREAAFEVHGEVRSEVEAATAAMDSPKALKHILQMIAKDKDNLDLRNALRVVFLIIEALELGESLGAGLKDNEQKGLVDLAENLLRLIGVAPVQSKLSYVHGLIKTIESQRLRRTGRHFLAAWEGQRAHFLSRRSPLPPSYQALAAALRSRRLGHMERAIQGFILAEELGAKNLEREKCILGKVQCYRLQGQRLEARTLLKDQQALIVSPEGQLEKAWEDLCLDASDTGELLPMINAVVRGDHKVGSAYQLEAQFWIRAVATKKFLDRLPKVETIRRKFRDSLKKPMAGAQVYEAVLAFEKAYDNDIPLAIRLADIGELLEKSDELPSIGTELLVYGAAARWAMRFHQYYLADLALEEYRGVCRKMTQGLQADVLGVVGDIDPKVWFHLEPVIRRKEFAEQPELDNLTENGTYRTFKLARLGFKISTVQFKNRVRSLFAAHQTKVKIREEELADIAEYIVNEVGAMKGPAVKIFQLAQMLSPGLPQPLQRSFEKTLDSLPSISPEVIRQILQKEWGQDPDSVLAEFDPKPLAAASLGQVHRAKLHTGEQVAVKIQYPGIENVIRNDINSFRLLLPFYGLLFPKADVKGNLWKSEMEFMQEIDYRREARMQNLIRKKTRHDKRAVDIHIPKVYQDYCTGKVLVMELVKGQKLWEFAGSASQEDRDEVGQKLFRYMLRSFFIYGAFNADPHPGNFLIDPDSKKIHVLDYGFAFTYPEDRRRLWAYLAVAIAENNQPEFNRLIQQMGYVGDASQFHFAAALKNTRAILNLGTDSPDDPIPEDMVQVLGQKLTVKAKNRKHLCLPLEDNALPRFLLGIMGTISKLQPRGDWGRWYTDFAREFFDEGPISLEEDLESA